MNYILYSLLLLLVSINTNANCDLKSANQILELIKSNHPHIRENLLLKDSLVGYIDQAKEIPNPELDFATSKSSNSNQESTTSSISLKHVIELGGKRGSRIRLAKNKVETKKSILRYENENTIIKNVVNLHRLRQIYELVPLYKESITAFKKIYDKKKNHKSLSPIQRVELDTLTLAMNDYRLKLSNLETEMVNLNNHLAFFMGMDCNISKDVLPRLINLNEKFDKKNDPTQYSKFKAAKSSLNVAKSMYELEESMSYPNLKIGPTYDMTNNSDSNSNSLGLALTLDLPIFNTNKAAKKIATKNLLRAKLQFRNIELEGKLDLNSWIIKYNRFRKSLKSITNKSDLEKKHLKIENLFKRGVIPTSLVIESHRQLIEFTNSRFSFEQGAIQALWKIYEIKGEIENKKIN